MKLFFFVRKKVKQENVFTYTIAFSIIAISILSLLSTAFATVLYYKIIHDYGPNFLSLVNYPIPVFAFFAGIIFLNEKFNTLSILSLILVVLSVYISQKK